MTERGLDGVRASLTHVVLRERICLKAGGARSSWDKPPGSKRSQGPVVSPQTFPPPAPEAEMDPPHIECHTSLG